jgi:phosphatidate cytidylyltransferase
VTDTPHIAPALRNPGIRNLRFSMDWITRPLFGVLLAALVVLADFGGPEYLALLVAAGAAFAAREWHRMVWPQSFRMETVFTVVTISGALLMVTLRPHEFLSLLVLGAGAVAMAVLALLRGENPLWQAGGPLYIGIPSLALIATRAIAADGAWVIAGLFLIVWATDTGALVAGNLIGGPKLAPVLSPNKTWAGTLGGIAAAAAVEAIYVAAIGGAPVPAAAYGAGLAIVAHAGDLFESWVKRFYHRKDSGTLIPGHGGALDRVDSTLSAAAALAVLVLFLGLDPLFGGRP